MAGLNVLVVSPIVFEVEKMVLVSVYEFGPKLGECKAKGTRGDTGKKVR